MGNRMIVYIVLVIVDNRFNPQCTITLRRVPLRLGNPSSGKQPGSDQHIRAAKGKNTAFIFSLVCRMDKRSITPWPFPVYYLEGWPPLVSRRPKPSSCVKSYTLAIERSPNSSEKCRTPLLKNMRVR